MYSTLSWTRTLVFFLDRRALSLFLVRGAFLAIGLERLLVAARVGGLRIVGRGPAAGAGRVAAATFAAVVLGDLGGRPAQARAELVGHHLDHRALLAFLRLPRALLEATVHEDPGPLLQRVRRVLAEGPPGGDVEERGLLFPLAVALEATVDGHSECGDRLAGRGEPQLGIASDVANEGHGVVGHV